jgi:hypothetical protein
LRRLPATLTLTLAAAALALLLAEATVRHVRPGLVAAPALAGNPFWRHDPALGWFHLPGQTGRFFREEFTHHVTINRMGFRDVERDLEAAGDGRPIRVVVLGDSFAWGHGVQDEEIFTRLLEGHLPGMEIWNLAVSAYSTDQELLLLREWGPRIRPDLVLVMVSRNDFTGNVATRYDPYFKPRFMESSGALTLTGVPVPPPGLLSRVAIKLRSWSAFFNGLWLLAGDPGRAPGVAGGWEAQAPLMGAILDGFWEETGALGADLALGIVPSVAHVYYPEVHRPEARGDAMLEEWGEARGVVVLDLVPAFRKAFQETGERYHYRRDKHWNAGGHRLAAETLAALLGEKGLLEASTRRTRAPAANR